MHPQGFNENSGLRASDADRDGAASVINNALAEGRLTAEEHSDRLDAIYAAKTHAELVPLLADLPATSAASPVTPAAAQPGASRRGGRIIAVLGGASRKGTWHADPVINVVTVLGGAELDFREAILPGNEVVIRSVCILGGLEITIPPEMQVIDNGIAILGGHEITGRGSESADAQPPPVLRIEGFCLLGGVEVKRKPRRGEREGTGPEDAILPGGLPGLAEARYQRRELHHQMHQHRHDLRHQLRDQRRDMRRGWTGDDDD